jgi:DNA-binding CsgD family transcriptional regulator
MSQYLRPIERRVLALREEGLDTAEIGRRFRRSPDHIERIIAWSDIPRTRLPSRSGLSPIERSVKRMRGDGLSYEEIGQRLRHSPDHIIRLEGHAELRHQLGLA